MIYIIESWLRFFSYAENDVEIQVISTAHDPAGGESEKARGGAKKLVFL